MAARLSLANKFFRISHPQFISIAQDFRIASEWAFGTGSIFRIHVYDNPKTETAFCDDAIRAKLDFENDKKYSGTYDLDGITPEVWAKAGYVEVILKPDNKEKAPSYAFSLAEFLGNRPRHATFYIQPGECGEALKHLKNRYRTMIAGSGWASHATQSIWLPASLSGLPVSRFKRRI